MKKIICSVLLTLILSAMLVFGPLFLLDIFHEQISGILGEVGVKHYFDGEAWFSAIATAAAAIPGICFGALALFQTKRNFDLENRYHRPSIRLNQAKIVVDRLNDGTYKESTNKRFKDYVRMIHKVNPEANFMTFLFEVEILNDVEIQNIILKELVFCLNKGCYRMKILSEQAENDKFSAIYGELKDLKRRYMKRDIKNGKRIYVIEWDVFPYNLLEVNFKRKEEKFWQELEWFLNYDNWRQESHANMELFVQADIEYEYAAEKCEKLYGQINWSCCKAERHGARAVAESCDGFFSFQSIKARKVKNET